MLFSAVQHDQQQRYDLLSALENEMFDEIQASALEDRDDIDKLTELIFIRFSEKKEIWQLLLSDHGNLSFIGKIYHFFDGCFAKKKTSKESELRYRFLLYGCSGIFDHWVKSGMKESPSFYMKKCTKIPVPITGKSAEILLTAGKNPYEC